MGNTLYLLRHAETKKDKSSPVSEWTLSEEGIRHAEELAKSSIFGNVDVVISSNEEKAYQTAKSIANMLGKNVIRIQGFNELDRDAGGFLEKEEFDKTINFAMANIDESRHGWEPAKQALERFEKAVNGIDSEYERKKILIVSHGCVLNLYFAKLLDKLDEVNNRWKKTDFCSYGIVKDGKVVKDIIK